jgi:hypothetical protein
VLLTALAVWPQGAGPAGAGYDPLETGLPPAQAEHAMRDRAARWFEDGELRFFGELVAQSFKEAVEFYRMAAEYGHAEALYSLGYHYAQGLGVERDEAAALDFYRRAAQAGSAPAMNNLAYLYDVGEGVPRDEDEALRLYRLAVDGGDAAAMINVAIMLDEGRGCVADPHSAAWFLIGAFLRGIDAAEEWLFDYADEWAVTTRREVQRILSRAGVYHGPLDGEIDAEVRAALRAYRYGR